jgi:dynein heavy chain 1, cytosolic
MTPRQGKWLVVFCDEINLPSEDKYGTQRVIAFMRHVVEQGGFWRAKGPQKVWVTLERIQFVGACNPPTDPGRVPLSQRFLRHAPVLLVDFPVTASLYQIYGAFNRALLKLHPSLRGYADPLTAAMVEFYSANQAKFTADQHPHYIYSPRELSKWTRAIYEGIQPLDSVSVDELVRLWLHEGLRLFCDRLVTPAERRWCHDTADDVAQKHFPSIDAPAVLARPVIFSKWLVKNYTNADKEELRKHVQARLTTFYEEELNVPLVVFDSVLENATRIERVLNQPFGHMLLVGDSGAGKTVLSRFVAWAEGLSIFQVCGYQCSCAIRLLSGVVRYVIPSDCGPCR